MKRVLLIGLLGVLGGLAVVGLAFQFMVPGGLGRLFKTMRRVQLSNPSEYEPFKVGDKFPDLQLKDLDGNPYRLSDHPRKLLLVNIFSPG